MAMIIPLSDKLHYNIPNNNGYLDLNRDITWETKKENIIMTEEAFYYLRDKEHAPRVTVCLMRNDENIICRGLAVCSLSETPSKKDIFLKEDVVFKRDMFEEVFFTECRAGGQTIARTRAKTAFLSKRNDGEIRRLKAINVLYAVGDTSWLYKSEYNVKPKNEFEKRLIGHLCRNRI